MKGLEAAAVLIAVLLGVLLVVAFDLFCLVHLAARDNRGRLASKLAWAVAIVGVSPFGGLVYLLMAARPARYPPRLGDASQRRRLPAPGRQPAGFPAGGRFHLPGGTDTVSAWPTRSSRFRRTGSG